MVHKTPKAESDRGPLRWSGWKRVATVVLVVVVAGGLGVGLRLWQAGRNGQANPPTGAKLQPAVEESVGLVNKGDFTQAHDVVDKALAKSNLSAQQKYELYFQQGSIYNNEDKYQQALDSFKQAEVIQPTQDLYHSMANTALRLGDKQGAIGYYRKALQYVPSDSPLGDADKEYYETQIRQLEAQP